ncbi:hypothetical protein PGS49_20960 [Yersinia intermedia]|uniref:hypothetical protein n=1 Tax=Yersinia intermedia TaxID=631 RepID=UPI0022FE6BB9|nr:hypothetical protein [Yersinia intermedia]MDA5483092.1 hypothetical protein [Yersinia intermedia]
MTQTSSQEAELSTKEPADMLHRRAVNRFNSLHSAILGEISSMLKKASLLPIPELQRNNPTFTEIVKQLKFFRELSDVAVKMLKIDKAEDLRELDDYILHAENLAEAIDSDDYDALCGAIAALNDKPYI